MRVGFVLTQYDAKRLLTKGNLTEESESQAFRLRSKRQHTPTDRITVLRGRCTMLDGTPVFSCHAGSVLRITVPIVCHPPPSTRESFEELKCRL